VLDLTNDPPNATVQLSLARPLEFHVPLPDGKAFIVLPYNQIQTGSGSNRRFGARGLAGSSDGALGDDRTDLISNDEEDLRSNDGG
jgi:hypothetical protein